MAVQKLDIKKLVGEVKKSHLSNNSQKKSSKESGSILMDLAQTGMTALPFVPKKYLALAGLAIGIFLYGVGSLLYDIVNLFL